MNINRLISFWCQSACWLMLLGSAAPLHGQDETSTPSPAAQTISDSNIPTDELHVQLRPLTQEELEVEVAAWTALLQDQIRQVGAVELQIKSLAEGESGDELKNQLVELRTAESALVERLRIVLDSLESKGGDVQSTTQFIDAVSDLGETTDVTSFWAAVVGSFFSWIRRDDGGKYWAMRLTLAATIFFIAWLISKFAGRLIGRAISRHPQTSNLLENFARRTTGGVVLVVGALMALAALGVQIGPMMAALGAGGFIVGFALQETLGNFASGLMIMVYRPFDVDDYVEVAGVEGTVKEMSLVSTTLLTVDNKVLVIPNKMAWGDTITNYMGRDVRRVDLVFGIGYDDNIQHAIEVLTSITSQHPLVLEDPALMIEVGELADSSVNLLCRPWTKTEDYWRVYWDLTRQVKERFDEEGISIPFPQRDVHTFAGDTNSDA